MGNSGNKMAKEEKDQATAGQPDARTDEQEDKTTDETVHKETEHNKGQKRPLENTCSDDNDSDHDGVVVDDNNHKADGNNDEADHDGTAAKKLRPSSKNDGSSTKASTGTSNKPISAAVSAIDHDGTATKKLKPSSKNNGSSAKGSTSTSNKPTSAAVSAMASTTAGAAAAAAGAIKAEEEASKSSSATTIGTTSTKVKAGDASATTSQTEENVPAGTVGIQLYSEFDVLSGRGGGTNVHAGNRDFRDMINQNREQYLRAKKNDKPVISRSIVRAVRSKGGRFLKLNEKDKLYYEIGDDLAREKTSQCLRQKAPEIRKMMYESTHPTVSGDNAMSTALAAAATTSNTSSADVNNAAIGIPGVFTPGLPTILGQVGVAPLTGQIPLNAQQYQQQLLAGQTLGLNQSMLLNPSLLAAANGGMMGTGTSNPMYLHSMMMNGVGGFGGAGTGALPLAMPSLPIQAQVAGILPSTMTPGIINTNQGQTNLTTATNGGSPAASNPTMDQQTK